MSDAELIAGLKSHSEHAYREVIARYGDALYGYVVRITGNPALSEEIIGETYLRLVEQIDSYVYTGVPIKSWLYRVAHNLAINALRRSARSASEALAQEIADDVDLSGAFEAREEQAALRNAIAKLTDDQQQVILLRFMGGQSISEVAAALDKSESAIKQLQLRALRALARILSDPAAPPENGETYG